MTLLAGRITVVTGASRGIGAATAEAMWQAGADVVQIARSLPAASQDRRWNLPCDLSVAGAAARAAGETLARKGAPDIVVNSAGAFLLRPLEDTEESAFDEQLAINLRAPFALLRAFLPAMRAAGRGLLVNVGSVSDHVAYPENAAYAASKFGLRGLHESLVEEYRGSGVRLTLISPGPTDTAVWDPVDPDSRPGLVPRARMLRPEDVADAILFVATRPAHVHIDWLRLGPA